MPRIILTAPARADLDSIWGYIAADNPDAADLLLEDIADRLRLAALQPEIGTRVEHLAAGCRRLGVRRKYLVYFRGIEGGIEVVRVLHGARYIHAGYFPD